ncbi:hypothetical protein [Nitrosospira multiformis]|nr:hypothetical protein [Nitrosospira multiformis]
MGKSNVILVALGFAVSSAVVAQQQRLPSDVYEVYTADKERIEREYKADKQRCDSLDGNAEDICEAEAKGREEVAKAELEDKYRPSKESRYEVRAAKAKADYRVAKERCDDLSGNVKDVCLEEAKAAQAAAIADAKRED